MATMDENADETAKLEETENQSAVPNLDVPTSSSNSLDFLDTLIKTGCLKEELEKPSCSDTTIQNGCLEEPEFSNETSHRSLSEETKKIPFVYRDWDTLENELAEIYGYYELSNFSNNLKAFNSLLKGRENCGANWEFFERADKINFIHDLLDQLDIANRGKQLEALSAMNYIVQGCWGEFPTLFGQLHWTKLNVGHLLECDAFWRVWEYFKAVSEEFRNSIQTQSKFSEEDILSVPLFENSLNILCTLAIVAVVGTSESETDTGFQKLLDEICMDDELVIATLLKTLNQIKSISAKCFMVKKLLLLIRSILLLTLGGTDELRKLKASCRTSAGLKPTTEDTIQMCQNMEPLQSYSMWSGMKARQKLMTWAEFADAVVEDTTVGSDSKKSLPWSPKSSLKTLQTYLCLKDPDSEEDRKYYSMQSIGNLPVPVKQRIQLLIQYLHVPLADHQIEQEKVISKYPYRFKDDYKPFVEKTERVFEALVPILEDTIRSLVNILSEATPRKYMKQRLFVPRTVKPFFTYSNSEDSRRQAEIVAKAISAILLLLLKHTRINHIYQFECISSEFVAASFVPTALRYFNGDVEKCIQSHGSSQNVSSRYKVMNGGLLSYNRSMDGAGYEENVSSPVSWRNMFACINLLRILNKIMKEKSSRILMLKMFKASDCLKRCLKVRDSIFQQYVLKLLKMLCKHLGKEWRRSNQQVVSAIYYKVRHRMLDDWMGGGVNTLDMKSWPWEYFEDEKQLNQDVLAYLKRRNVSNVENVSGEIEIEDLDKSEAQLSEAFKVKYEDWLEREVYSKQVDWDALVKPAFIV